jgi:hypothetical protein
MKIWQRIVIAGVCAVCVTALAGAAQTASADAVLPPPVQCTLQFAQPLGVDDFVVHSTVAAMCNAYLGQLDVVVELLRDGVSVDRQQVVSDNVIGAMAQVRTRCVTGNYQATGTAQWLSASGTSEGKVSTQSPIMSITC